MNKVEFLPHEGGGELPRVQCPCPREGEGARELIEFYLTTDGSTQKVDVPEPGCWVNVVAPTAEERAWLTDGLGVCSEFVTAATDDEERPRVDFDDDTGQRLIIIDCPFIEEAADTKSADIVQYDTHPLSFIMLPEEELIVTLSLLSNETIALFTRERLSRINTRKRTRLLLLLLANVSWRYQVALRSINRQFTASERRLRENMRNEELMQMLGFQNSLIYISVSLKADIAVLTRVKQGRVVGLYEEDSELLEDVTIEFNQAIEMCTIYTEILEVTMDTFSSVINNNVNVVMRRLTVIALVLAIPTIVFSFYGMNVDSLPGAGGWFVPIAFSIVACVLTAFAIWGSRWLR